MAAIDKDGYSLSALAKVLGRAKSGLHKLAKSKQIPQQLNGKFNLAAVQAALASNLEPGRAKRVHRNEGERSPGEQVNKVTDKAVTTPEDAAEVVSLIKSILQDEGVAAGVIDFNAARTAELIVKTRRRWIESEEKAKRLVDADAMREEAWKWGRENRDAWMNWPSRIGPMIASELGIDPVRTIIALENYVRGHLSEMADENQIRARMEDRIKAL